MVAALPSSNAAAAGDVVVPVMGSVGARRMVERGASDAGADLFEGCADPTAGTAGEGAGAGGDGEDVTAVADGAAEGMCEGETAACCSPLLSSAPVTPVARTVTIMPASNAWDLDKFSPIRDYSFRILDLVTADGVLRWSGRRESNPHHELGRLELYH